MAQSELCFLSFSVFVLFVCFVCVCVCVFVFFLFLFVCFLWVEDSDFNCLLILQNYSLCGVNCECHILLFL